MKLAIEAIQEFLPKSKEVQYVHSIEDLSKLFKTVLDIEISNEDLNTCFWLLDYELEAKEDKVYTNVSRPDLINFLGDYIDNNNELSSFIEKLN